MDFDSFSPIGPITLKLFLSLLEHHMYIHVLLLNKFTGVLQPKTNSHTSLYFLQFIYHNPKTNDVLSSLPLPHVGLYHDCSTFYLLKWRYPLYETSVQIIGAVQ